MNVRGEEGEENERGHKIRREQRRGAVQVR